MSGNFVYDNTALPTDKVNLEPLDEGDNPNNYVQDTDYNALKNALLDVRSAITGSRYVNFQDRSAQIPGSGVNLQSTAGGSGSQLTAVFSDGTTQVIATAAGIVPSLFPTIAIEDVTPATASPVSGQTLFRSNNGILEVSPNGGAWIPLNRPDLASYSASTGALTPTLGSSKIYYISLNSASLTINAPTYTGAATTASTAAGVKLLFVFKQDSTGYRTVTLNTAYGATNFYVRQGPNQQSSLEVTLRPDGTLVPTHFDGIDLTQPLNVKDFGAKGDGVATNEDVAIQAAIDFAIYRAGFLNRPNVTIPAGTYIISKTIQLGYGETLHGIQLSGAGMNRGSSAYGGTVLQATFSNQPAINVQGGRMVVIKDLSVYGLLVNWINSNALGQSADFIPQTDPLIDDTDPANWVDSSLDANQDSRYAPYAGIAIDAYSGSQPTPHYPDLTFPSFSGVSGQYNKAPSSNTRIENVYIYGFNTGVVVKPSGADGNGDFTQLSNCLIDSCKWGVSVAHTQSRNVDLQNVAFAFCYACLTSNTHGLQNGKFGGALVDCSAGACIELFKFGSMTIGGPITATNFYAEAIWRLGDYIENASNAPPLKFIGGEFSFGLQNNRRGIPATVMGPSSQVTHVVFDGCTFNNFPSVVMFDENGAEFPNCLFHPDSRETGVSHPYQAYAHNCLLGGLVIPGLASARCDGTNFFFFNLDTASIVSNAQITRDYRFTNRPYCVPLHTGQVMPTGADFRDILHPPQYQGFAWDKSYSGSVVSTSLSGTTLTVVLPSIPGSYYDLYGMNPGDVWLDQDSNTVFFVRSRTGTTVIGEAQNNYKLVSSVNTVQGYTTNVGYLYAVSSRFYTPSSAVYGDFEFDSNTITNVERSDSYAGFLSTDIVAGDRFFVDEVFDLPIQANSANVTAVDGTAKTITFGGGALTTQARRRLPWFIRSGPSNV